MPKRKLIIFSDQQGKNLGPLLHNMYGAYFDVMCHTNPGASTKNTLRLTKNYTEILNADDFLIFLTGTNDTDPNDLFANVYCAIQQLSQTNIILMQVPYQRHLNKRALNRMLLQITTRFNHCEYLSSDFNIHQFKTTPLKVLAGKIFEKVAGKLYNTQKYDHQLLRRNTGKTSTSAERATNNNAACRKTVQSGPAEEKSELITEPSNENKFFRRKRRETL
jgi:hypothetical protein